MHKYNPITRLEQLEDKNGSHDELVAELCEIETSEVVDHVRKRTLERLLRQYRRLISEGVGYHMGYAAAKKELGGATE